MSQSKIIVGHEELFRFIRDALVMKGARPEDAAIVADGLVWANLRGVDGHGLSRLPFYLRMIERGDIDVTAKPSLEQDRIATFVLDSGRGFGPVAMMQSLRLLPSGPSRQGCATASSATRPIPAPSAAMRNRWQSAAAPR